MGSMEEAFRSLNTAGNSPKKEIYPHPVFARSSDYRIGMLELGLRGFLGMIFVVSGALKVWSPVQFQQDILQYQLLPYMATALLAVYLPWLEILCGIALLVRKYYRGALAILSVLMGVFLLAYLQALWRGIQLQCGCFGELFRQTPPWVVVVRNLFFLECLTVLWFLLLIRSPSKKV